MSIDANIFFVNDGTYYDMNFLETIIKFFVGDNYIQLLDIIVSKLENDSTIYEVEIYHRNLLSVFGRI